MSAEGAFGGGWRIEDVLAREGVFASTTSGTSMWPLFRDRRDTAVVVPPARRLRRFDVALYRRGGAYVLHRVVRVEPGGYVTLGDNCLACERVPEAAVIGVLAQLYRGERPVDLGGVGYRAYVRAWCALYPARRALMRARARLGRARRRLGEAAHG